MKSDRCLRKLEQGKVPNKMNKSIKEEAGELDIVLRAKATHDKFTQEEKDWLRYAGATLSKLGRDYEKMEIAIRAIFEWTKTDKNSTQSRAKAMKNLQDICSRVLNEIHSNS